MRRGFKVSVSLVDPLAAQPHAAAVNIERAVDGGTIAPATTAQSLVYSQADLSGPRAYPYGPGFSWWYYAQPSAPSSDTGTFVDALAGAGGTRVAGASELGWDTGTAGWNADTAILLPVALPAATVTQGYSAGAMQIAYTDPVSALTVTRTVLLTEAAGGGQTVVLKVAAMAMDSGLDAPADWAADLGAGAHVRVSVVPEADGSLAAYSVVIVQ